MLYSHKMEQEIISSPLYSDSPPKCYLIACNPKKSTCLGPILRCASAFGVHQILLVGYAKCSTEGAHGADKHMSITSFPTMEQAAHYVKSPSGGNCVEIIGILNGFPQYNYHCTNYDNINNNSSLPIFQDHERSCFLLVPPDGNSGQPMSPSIVLDPRARLSWACYHRKFSLERNTCFFVSQSARGGLPLDQGNHCDSFVHIPHCFIPCKSTLGNAVSLSPSLLNVETCLSIVLHHFASLARYDERTFHGHKFNVNPRNTHWKNTAIPSNCEEGEGEQKSACALPSEQRQKSYCYEESEQTQDELDNFFHILFTPNSLSGDY